MPAVSNSTANEFILIISLPIFSNPYKKKKHALSLAFTLLIISGVRTVFPLNHLTNKLDEVKIVTFTSTIIYRIFQRNEMITVDKFLRICHLRD